MYSIECDRGMSQQDVAIIQCAALPGGSPAECQQPILALGRFLSKFHKIKLILIYREMSNNYTVNSVSTRTIVT